jgi:hypothetical protein
MDEETILNVGEAYENATDWKKEKPKLWRNMKRWWA